MSLREAVGLRYSIILVVMLLLWPVTAFAEEQTVVFAVGEYPPYVSEHLPEYGMYAQIVQESFEQVDISTSFTFMPWRRCLEEVRRGTVLGTFPYFYAEERTANYIYSEPLGESRHVFFYLPSNTPDLEFTSFEALKDYKIGGAMGYIHEKIFAEHGLSPDVCQTIEQSLRQLEAGRVDMVPENEVVGWTTLTMLFPEKLGEFETTSPFIPEQSTYSLFSKAYPNAKELLLQFNEGLKLLKQSGRYQEIRRLH